MTNPLISVIIPTRGREEKLPLLRIALDSIVNQTYTNLEIILVYDGEGSENVLKPLEKSDPRIRVIASGFVDPERNDPILRRNINAGYSARNAGLAVAKGELITFQDADDASFLNRIATQYELLVAHDAIHVTTSCVEFDAKKLGKVLDTTVYQEKHSIDTLGPTELYDLSQKTKGLVAKLFPKLNRNIPFHFKRKRIIHRLFFGSLESYPEAGNSPLFRREVIDQVRFRKLSDRVWPSFMGRGADRDFNFQVAETFKQSRMFSIPLYMWRTDKAHDATAIHNLDTYLHSPTL